ncbi:3-hydroxyacyl-CoA dehydrogenase family protein [Desulfosarcina ovata]|uniref:3-hydroxybutyryl-CoA dehydrogenase n=2 Tax=Desulfosarcina ovata TaxID=83564 RepID=A0A5K8AJR6_9BACT|nr:3-hydroxyacyl-CoA dehydrogenase NAD-binding domain-containing protein [Desulfosarcina ovata]BBO85989.1 3-hydroxybutyryl-CoA dehydrogenase [Desulfosarcina ovata subsp. sediminis]BBO92947.1 3-hydroxybutyryl-CoA dehydrogenase [Desulfosarcina ovata subsp. ovata]
MEIKKIGVLGTGQMGSGIIQVLAQSGYDVIGVDASEQMVDKCVQSIDKRLAGRVQKGKMRQEEKDAVMARISTSQKMEDLSDCDLIEEAIPEILELKKEAFSKLDNLCKPETIFGTNTSGLSVTDMAAAVKRGDKLLGVHFHKPAPVMRLLELVRTIMTSTETIETVKAFGETLSKTVVVAPDVGGFIVTRLFTPFLLGAVRMLEEDIATRDEIDVSMKLAVNHPMGPLQVVDFIGLDTELSIAESLYEETKDPKYAPPVLLKKMVSAGWLGIKTGKGFYEYNEA